MLVDDRRGARVRLSSHTRYFLMDMKGSSGFKVDSNNPTSGIPTLDFPVVATPTDPSTSSHKSSGQFREQTTWTSIYILKNLITFLLYRTSSYQ